MTYPKINFWVTDNIINYEPDETYEITDKILENIISEIKYVKGKSIVGLEIEMHTGKIRIFTN